MKKTLLTALLLTVCIGVASVPEVSVQAKIQTHSKPSLVSLAVHSADDATTVEETPSDASTTPTPDTLNPDTPLDTPVVVPTPAVQDPAPASEAEATTTTSDEPVRSTEPVFTPTPVSIPDPTPAPVSVPTKPTKTTLGKPTKSTTHVLSTTTGTSTASSSAPFTSTLGTTITTGNIYNTSSHLPPELTRILLEVALLLGASGLVLAQERGLRTTFSRVWG
jgi:outer membrane biosynthesis protein TonB